MTQSEVDERIALHELWLKGDSRGKRADFSKKRLYGLDLGNCNLAHARFFRANLVKTRFSGSNLKSAYMRGVFGWKTDFSGANLTKARLFAAYCPSSNFSDAVLEGANIKFGNFSHSSFESASMKDTVLAGSKLCQARLTAKELAGAIVDDCDLRVTEENLNRAFARHRLWLEGKPGGKRLNLAGASLCRLDPGGSIDLRRAVFNRCDLRSAVLQNCDLSDAELSEVNLQGGLLTGAKFDSADMRKACLFGANLEKADMRNCDLSEAELSCAQIVDCDLRGAILTDAIFWHSVMDNVKLDGAMYSRDAFSCVERREALFADILSSDT